MDADFKEKRSAKISSNGEKRWSMNSQRLEEIVAELMRPIGDLRHSFDTDLSALLEEYLTEAGLHALAAEEGSPVPSAVPNFAELALLLQQSASIYGRKVDFLYQHVLSVSDSLHNSTIEIANTSNEEEVATPGGSRRKRHLSAPTPSDFAPIHLEASGACVREAGATRPPPTLPRMYIELEPRVLPPGEEPLRDYGGEPIGVLADFHVSWRLHNGLLVEELEGWEGRQSLRPIPLMELQAAIEANAPPSPPPLPPTRDDTPPPHDLPPHQCSTPLPHEQGTPPDQDMPPPPLPVKKERKRKAVEELNGASIKLCISKELRRVLSRTVEFDGASEWIARVVADRRRALLEIRQAAAKDHLTEFRGFEFDQMDISGFVGWSDADAASAAAVATRLSSRLTEDSDDDGFFEQSSLGDSDGSRADDSPMHSQLPNAAAQPEKTEAELAEAAEWAAWRARVAARAAAGEQQAPLDVTKLAATVLDHVPDQQPKRFDRLLKEAAHEDTDVSRLFLATLFLANAGNVEVMQGPPLSLGTFSLKLLSRDARLYSAAAAADPISAPPPSLTSPPTTPAVTPARTNKK